MSQTTIVKRTEQICNEFDQRAAVVGFAMARAELAKALAEVESEDLAALEKYHPRAMKLIAHSKKFVVVAEDEPYYLAVYSLIREFEIKKGRWSDTDESLYLAAVMARRSATDPEAKP